MSDAPKNNNRRNGLLILGAVVVVGAIGYGLYWFLDARFYESTDDAYVAGNVVAVTSRESATVMSLHADNTQTVKQGQLLIEMAEPCPVTGRGH
jgi:membrane fusion protein (multidrug efflux system)